MITTLTELEASAAEYYTTVLQKIQVILKQNGSILKAGYRTVGENVFLGTNRTLPTLPGIHIEGARHSEGYFTFGDRENTIKFTVFIWLYVNGADTEDNEEEIHQLGDRIIEVFRQNEDLDGLVRQIPLMDIGFDQPARINDVIVRTGLLRLDIQKDINV